MTRLIAQKASSHGALESLRLIYLSQTFKVTFCMPGYSILYIYLAMEVTGTLEFNDLEA